MDILFAASANDEYLNGYEKGETVRHTLFSDTTFVIRENS